MLCGASPAKKGDINFALVGAGNLAKWAHLPALKKISGANLRAVHSNSGARGKAYANRFGAAYASSDYYEILADADIYSVIIASRHKELAEQEVAALNEEKTVFIEKHKAATIDECRPHSAKGG